MTIASYNISINRSDPFATSFDVYARSGGYPIEAGDGIYIGNFPISPWLSSINFTYTPPANGSWFFLAVPIAMGMAGPAGRIT